MLKTTRFDSSKRLEETINHYVMLYNHEIPQKALGHEPPTWYKKCPALFRKLVYNLTKCDIPGVSEDTSPSKYIHDIEQALSRVTSKKLKHIKSKGCYFSNSLDENYIIDKMSNNCWAIAGLSGHGFKFAPALASGLLDSIENNSLIQEFSKFSLERFSAKNITPRTHVSESDLMLGSLWEI